MVIKISRTNVISTIGRDLVLKVKIEDLLPTFD